MLVPVKPVWPKVPAGPFLITEFSGSIIQPRPFLKLSFLKNNCSVFSFINCLLPALPLCNNISTSFCTSSTVENRPAAPHTPCSAYHALPSFTTPLNSKLRQPFQLPGSISLKVNPSDE